MVGSAVLFCIWVLDRQSGGRMCPFICCLVVPPRHCLLATPSVCSNQNLLRINSQSASIQPSLQFQVGLWVPSPRWPNLCPTLGEEKGEGTACSPKFLRVFQLRPCLQQARSQILVKETSLSLL